jgi:hypothetical protein
MLIFGTINFLMTKCLKFKNLLQFNSSNSGLRTWHHSRVIWWLVLKKKRKIIGNCVKFRFSHIITVCFVVFTLMKIEDQDLRLDKKRKLTVEFGKNFPLVIMWENLNFTQLPITLKRHNYNFLVGHICILLHLFKFLVLTLFSSNTIASLLSKFDCTMLK